MKNLILLFIIISLTSCASKQNFPDKDVCFILFNLKTEKFEEIHNEKRCHERFPAASTFKVALSVMAFDTGILKDESNPVYKWNKVPTPLENWNKDQTPTTWMRESVVWMSQEITPKIGMKKIEQYLSDFQYGNQDMTAGLKYAWLTPAPFIKEPMQNSLKISGFEQVNFLAKLWRGELKASKESQLMTLKIMTHDKSSRGSELIGKTGSGFKDENYDLRLGWFVGVLKKEQTEYIVILNFSDIQKQPAGIFGGREAKETALKLLSEKKLW
jgi:beta-lactamase class D